MHQSLYPTGGSGPRHAPTLAARAVALGWLWAFALFTCAPASAQSLRGAVVEELDRVIAVVDEDVIVMSELVEMTRTVMGEIDRSGAQAPPRAVLERQVLDRLIGERLQLQVAERLGIRVRDDELNRAVANIAKRNDLGLAEFREILEADGVAFSVFRERIRKEMVISRVRQRQVRNRIRVREAEIDRYLALQEVKGGAAEAYRLAHILIAVAQDAPEAEVEAKERTAKELLQSLHGGADFAALAMEHSEGGRAEEGGDLGWRERDKLPSIFAELVPTLERGEIGGPIRSGSGFHIVKVTDIKNAAQSFINQTRAAHILLQTNELVSDADARTRLEQLRERIIQGEDFGELARSNSDDRGSAVRNGDLGWVNPGDLVPAFEKVMNEIAIGEVSEPFQSSFGWHILRVSERREHDNTTENRRAEARTAIRARRTNDELEAWLTQLRDEAYIEYRLEE